MRTMTTIKGITEDVLCDYYFLNVSPVVRDILVQAQEVLSDEQLRSPEFVALVKKVLVVPPSQRDGLRRKVLRSLYERELGECLAMLQGLGGVSFDGH